jgi:hypothetical protein
MAEPITINETDYRTFLRYQDIGSKYDGPDGLRKKLDKLEEDAATFRTKAKELEGRVPGDGSVVLSADDAKRWDAFLALKKTPEELAAGVVLTAEERKKWEAFAALDVKPEDIPAIVEENKTLKEKDALRTWGDGVAALAEAEGIPKDSVPALSAILRTLDPAAVVEVKTEKQKDGAGVEVEKKAGYVTLTGKQPVRFADLHKETPELKGIRTTAAEQVQDDDGKWIPSPTTGNKGGYDAAKVGKEMAERHKASAGAGNLALT